MKTKQVVSRHNVRIILALIILIQLCVMLYFANQKVGYHEDEIYSYGLSNSYFEPFFVHDKDYYNNWHTSSLYEDYITVQDNERFQYNSVYYNQQQDVHPPLFYFLLHTLCSLAPNTFSKWTGLSINFVCFIISNILLFLLGKRIFNNESMALLPCFFWGFSAGAISSVMFIRMYSMLTCWTLLITLLAFQVIDREKLTLRIFILLFLTTILGFLTQYYFLIYTFFLSCAIAVVLIIKKRFKDLWKCAGCVIGGIVIAILYFPASIYHIFSGYRGKQNQVNLFNMADWKKHWGQYKTIINNEIFGGFLKLFLILLIICLVIWITTHFLIKLHINYDKAHNKIILECSRINFYKSEYIIDSIFIQIATVLLTSIGYYVVITKIAPYQVDRYVFPIFPQIVLLFIFVLMKVLNIFLKNKKTALKIVVAVSIFLSVFGIAGKHVEYLFPDEKENLKKVSENSKSDCILITDSQWRTNKNIFQIMEYQKIYPTTYKNINLISNAIEKENISNPIVVYVDDSLKEDEIIKKLKAITPYTKSEKEFSCRGFNVYKLSNS